jgi:hypothetical protein
LTVIGALDSVNYGGGKSEIVLTSKWVTQFRAAVNRAHGRPDDSAKKA